MIFDLSMDATKVTVVIENITVEDRAEHIPQQSLPGFAKDEDSTV